MLTMEEEILNKIKDVLCKTTYSEQDVVYFLVESCKLLEQKKQRPEFDVIRFYRNWVCHPFLDKDSMKVFEEVYILAKARKYFHKQPLSWVDLTTDEIQKSFREYSLARLNGKIAEFSKQFLNRTGFNWENFRAKLYSVITDTPLLIKENGEEIFRFELKKIIDPITFGDLDIEAVVGKNHFSFSLDDLSLED